MICKALIWWLWDAFTPTKVHIFDVDEAWQEDDPDVYWLGECAWTSRLDNIGLGLK